jgi:hypothetical protein
MRRASLLAVPLLLLAPASASARVCVPPGHRVVKEGHHARVVVDRHRTHFACLFSRDRLERLDYPNEAEPSQASHFRLAGRFVAYEYVAYDAVEYYTSVRTLDLLDGRGRETTVSGDPDHPNDEVGELRVTRRGWVAWVACYLNHCGPGVPMKVWRSDSRGEKLLDRGQGIRHHTLRIRRHGRRVTWVRAGERRAATLR